MSAVASKKTPVRPSIEPRADKQPKDAFSAVREWTDAIVIAFLLAMFIRMFVVELFMIPSASMTPTLLGIDSQNGQSISFYDVNGDGQEDMILNSGTSRFLNVYYRKGKVYQYAGEFDPGYDRDLWMRKAQNKRQDKILVGKFFYWFAPPGRGDIVVFKVPDRPNNPFEPTKPIYIKRVVGLPGEHLTLIPAPGVPGHEQTMGYLAADGERVESPAFFKTKIYEYRNLGIRYPLPPTANYRVSDYGVDLVSADVPQDSVYVFGDNTVSSADSRYWGAAPLDRLRGRAIFRYLKVPGFLH